MRVKLTWFDVRGAQSVRCKKKPCCIWKWRIQKTYLVLQKHNSFSSVVTILSLLFKIWLLQVSWLYDAILNCCGASIIAFLVCTFQLWHILCLTSHADDTLSRVRRRISHSLSQPSKSLSEVWTELWEPDRGNHLITPEKCMVMVLSVYHLATKTNHNY